MNNFVAMKMPAIHLRPANRDAYLPTSAVAEFAGVLMFQLLAGSLADSALQAGLVLAALIYATKYISGGHLNPAVSLAAMLSGHIDFLRGTVYMCAQLLGGITGALLQSWLSPDSRIGKLSPGCYAPDGDVNGFQAFMWEAAMTFTFIAVMYASVFVRPGHGDAAPLAAGLALLAALSTGGMFTGGSPLNPARTLAAALVFKCFWRWSLLYVAAQLLAAGLAACWAMWAFGRGEHYKMRDSATGALRDSLLRGTGGAGGTSGGEAGLAGEPMGVTDMRYAASGQHYAGAGAGTGSTDVM